MLGKWWTNSFLLGVGMGVYKFILARCNLQVWAQENSLNICVPLLHMLFRSAKKIPYTTNRWNIKCLSKYANTITYMMGVGLTCIWNVLVPTRWSHKYIKHLLTYIHLVHIHLLFYLFVCMYACMHVYVYNGDLPYLYMRTYGHHLKKLPLLYSHLNTMQIYIGNLVNGMQIPIVK